MSDRPLYRPTNQESVPISPDRWPCLIVNNAGWSESKQPKQPMRKEQLVERLVFLTARRAGC